MNSRILGCLCLFTFIGLGCYGFEEDTGGFFEVEKETSDEPMESPPTASVGTGESKKGSESNDSEPGPCPVDRYVLLNENGVEYVVEIEVFCEPIPVYNLGCPPPPHI